MTVGGQPSKKKRPEWQNHPIFRGTILGKDVYNFILEQDRQGNYVGYVADPQGCRISIIAQLVHKDGRHRLEGRGLLTCTNDTGKEPGA